MTVYEITIEIRNIAVKILFRNPPAFKRICECVSIIFADHPHVEAGMTELVMSTGDELTVLNVGDRVEFTEDGEGLVGFMDLQSRTLFDD